MANTNRKLVEYIIQQLLELQNGKLWMGDNFQRKTDSITEQQAFTKPSLTLHSVAEIVAHLTAWSDDLILKIRDGTGKLQDNDDRNWPDNDILKKLGWNEIRRKYQDSISQVIVLLKEKDDSFLTEKYYDQDFKTEFDYSFVINGILQHNIYHLGQMGIIIKLVKEK
ncbi:DinB family protein [Algoriphagus sp. AGSA1]|uniref:DinB family protein n=1 Tax=Algoriphagus sp. AGSA1 TaxID=2907213 RepID=UPI001F32B0CC|nr:DinB family protein [Algoriphagus sp. AGSA1]MCE7056759.1 DinB family protein [Algoriphagus sp. AGSA1]